MKRSKKITGTVVYNDFEGGFWGIKADDNYLPIEFPEQLKYNGAGVTCYITTDDEMMSFINWGVPCVIVSFSTIDIK